jgi:chemotaxis protein methyltransferase CheR
VQSGAFFREPKQLALLASHVLPELARTGHRRIRLWSADCGAGEDAWSLAIAIEEADLPALAVDIVATDGDRRALAAAAAAVYRDDQMTGVSPERRHRHFVRGVGPRQGLWRVIAPLRDRVELSELDLAGPWPSAAPSERAFDAVFAPVARLAPTEAHRLAYRLACVLAPGGALFLGRSPGAPDAVPGLAPYAPGVFRKRAG